MQFEVENGYGWGQDIDNWQNEGYGTGYGLGWYAQW